MNLAALSESCAHWWRRLAPLAALALFASTLIGFAFWTLFAAESSSGLVRVLTEGLAGWFVAASGFGLQALVGTALITAAGWGRSLRGAGETLLFGWIAGFVASSGVLLVLAWVGGLESWSVVLCAVAGGAWSGWRLRETLSIRALKKALAGEPTGETDGSRGDVAGLALVVAIMLAAAVWSWPLIVQTFLPNSDWDSALYHLPLASRYLDGQLWNADPLFSAHSFPGAVSLVYAAFTSLGFEAAIIPYNFLGVLLVLLAAWCLADRLAGRQAAGWAVLVCAGAHILWQLGVDPRVDAFLGIAIGAAVLGLCIWLEDRSQTAALALMALSINAAIGAKYTGLFIGAAVAGLALLLVVVDRLRGSGAVSTRWMAAIALLILVPNGVWYASNTVLHGDPLFPMLRGDYYQSPERPGERIPTAGALDPALAQLSSDSLERRRALALRERFQSEEPENLFDVYDLLQRPDAYAVKPNHFASPLLFLFLALPFALPRESRRRAAIGCCYGLGGVCFLALASQTNLLRYVLPLFPLFAAGAGVVIAHFPSRLWQSLVLLIAVALLAQHHGAEVEKLASLHPKDYVESGGDRVTWLKRAGYNFTTSMPRVVDRINAEIEAGRMSEDDVILMVGEGKGRLLRCHYLPDLSWFLQRWVVELVLADHQPDAVLRSLRAQGVTHILYNKSYFAWVLGNTKTSADGIAYAMVRLERFLTQHSQRVLEAGGMGLFRLDEPDRLEPGAS